MNLSAALQESVRQVYRPPVQAAAFDLEKFYSPSRLSRYGFARHALHEALKLIRARIPGKHLVLVPEFICRDVLSALSALGLEPRFYPVDEQFRPIASELEPAFADPSILAGLVVDYFGFAQDLEPFKSLAQRLNIPLIEDNAHGLLSRDPAGHLLGSRLDYGLLSMRKTFPLMNGGALIQMSEDVSLPSVAESKTTAIGLRRKLKSSIREWVPLLGVRPIVWASSLNRARRKWKTGSEFVRGAPEDEFQLPEPKEMLNPEDLSHLDPVAEARRRRDLYLMLDPLLKAVGANPVFERLPEGCVPFAFPFRIAREQEPALKKRLFQLGLEANLWPDLPTAVLRQAPDHYQNVQLVRFMW